MEGFAMLGWLVELDTMKIKSMGFGNKTIGFESGLCHLLACEIFGKLCSLNPWFPVKGY